MSHAFPKTARNSVKRHPERGQYDPAVIYPIVFPDRTELLVSLPTGLMRISVSVTAPVLTKEVRAFRRAVEKRTTLEYVSHAQQLYTWLIHPLESELIRQKIETLVLVPDGVLRTIPFQIPDFEPLNLPDSIRTVAEARRGLIVITGATGNGKSTTIASIINHIIQQERLHVVTVEDPIEFIFSGGRGLVIQREVGSDTASYTDALRAALRQDPDIIMVGEIRDREAADICLKAAETGHLVITSLHTPDVPRAIGRLVGLFPADEQESVRARLADNLQAVIALRLLMRADATGLIPAVEALLATTSVRELVRDGTKINELRNYMDQAGADLGMHSFDQYLFRLHEAKRIGLDTALANATNRADLERRIMMETGGRTA